MTDAHKAALAEGRALSRAVRGYLQALEANRPKRGRKRTPESMKRRLESVRSEIESADPLRRVQLIQERIDLEKALAKGDDRVDISGLEAAFIKAAKGYSQAKGISYAAWREQGVSAQVLAKAGISRSS